MDESNTALDNVLIGQIMGCNMHMIMINGFLLVPDRGETN
jgi:hypothetical protein